MNLTNFEEQIDPVIVERGLDYYQTGFVKEIHERGHGKYEMIVEGTQDYTVSVTLDDKGEIIETSCDCPYDWSDYCKHQAVAFYALRDQLEGAGHRKETPKRVKKKQPDLYEELRPLSKEELLSLILRISEEHEDIKKMLLFQHAPEETLLREAQDLITGSIRHVEDRHGFIEWNKADQATEGAEIVLEQVRDELKKGNSGRSVSLCLTVLPEIVDMLQYCDDSDGGPGLVIDQCLELLKEAASSAESEDESVKISMFRQIMKELTNERYEGWTDWRISMLGTLIPFCGITSLRKKWEEEVDHLMVVPEGDSWSSQYNMEELLYLKLKLLEQLGEKDAAYQFLYDHIELGSFRERAIQYAMNRNQWNEVLRLCEEGEASPGLADKWMVYRLQACEKLGDVDQEKKLMLHFLYQGDYDYYEKLRNLYPREAWGEVSQRIITHFEQDKFPNGAYVKILIQEKMYEKLLNYCNKHPDEIESLYPHLKNVYPDDVRRIFTMYIEDEAENSSNRKYYRQVCHKIRTFKKACGEEAAHTLIDKLEDRYARRPAFVDELTRI